MHASALAPAFLVKIFFFAPLLFRPAMRLQQVVAAAVAAGGGSGGGRRRRLSLVADPREVKWARQRDDDECEGSSSAIETSKMSSPIESIRREIRDEGGLCGVDVVGVVGNIVVWEFGSN